jgi:hypothetical protein
MCSIKSSTSGWSCSCTMVLPWRAAVTQQTYTYWAFQHGSTWCTYLTRFNLPPRPEDILRCSTLCKPFSTVYLVAAHRAARGKRLVISSSTAHGYPQRSRHGQDTATTPTTDIPLLTFAESAHPPSLRILLYPIQGLCSYRTCSHAILC